jgi:hypothetical protein
MTVGLLINPLSGRRSGKGERLRRALGKRPPVEVAMLDEFSNLPAVLRHLADKGVDILAISSGDGTLHAIQTELAENQPFPKLPRLIVLPHGTANMSAGTIGFKHCLSDLVRLLPDRDLIKTLSTETRPTLRVINPLDGKARHGMFLGTGALYTATAYCQDVLHRAGLPGNAAILATLLRSLFDAAVRRPGTSSPAAIARSYELKVSINGAVKFSPSGLLFLATTLDKLVLGARPFWGGKTQPIRATAFPYPVPRFLPWLWPALYGSEDRVMPEGAVSFCSDSLEISGPTPFVMDGEFFKPPSEVPLRVETGPDFIYIRG